MTQSTCLHIQDRESGPIRVVELPGISVRIGRAPHCEIQLTELGRAEEVCRLLRRGRSWQLVPNGKGGPIRLEGRSLSGCCLLPFDVPFFVGSYCLTLRHDTAAEPDWGTYPSPSPVGRPRSATLIPSAQTDDEAQEPERLDARSQATAETAVDPATLRNLAPREDDELASSLDTQLEPAQEDERAPSPEKPPVPPQEDESSPSLGQPLAPAQEDTRAPSLSERWETRWRAAGAELKARSLRARGSVDPMRPDYQARLDPVPLKEPVIPRAHPVVPPSLDPAVRPAASIAPSRDESSFTRAKTEPSRTFAQADLPWARIKAEKVSARAPAEPAAPLAASWDAWLSQDQPPADPGRGPKPDDLADRLAAAPRAKPGAQAFAPSDAAADDRTVADQPAPTIVASSDDSSLVMIPAIDAYVAELSQAEPRPPEIVPEMPSPAQPAAASEATLAEARIAPPEEEPPIASSPAEPILHSIPSHGNPRDAVSRVLAADRRASTFGLEPVPKQHAASAKNVEWPSARDILASHRAATRPPPVVAAARKTPGRKTRPAAMPTLARAPGQWSPPVWLAGPPAAVIVLAAGIAGCFLSWRWAGDSYAASIVTDRLLTQDRIARSLPLPDSVSPPEGSWTSSTADHLARWAIYLSHFQPERRLAPEETALCLERALQVSPLDRVARLALLQLEPPGSDTAISIRSLGLSRDAVSLTFSARRLLLAGRKEAALKLYGRALKVAIPADSFRLAVPRFSEDSGVSRYLLPGEEQVRDILRELLSRSELSFADWSGLLPNNPVALLAAARLLREQTRGEAEAMIEQVLGESSGSAAGDPDDPMALAARAEAYALLSRWRDADRLYRQAIELVGDETIRRSWWFNLADVAFRLEDDGQRQIALQEAMAATASDDIRRRATDIQRASRPRTNRRSPGVKAN